MKLLLPLLLISGTLFSQNYTSWFTGSTSDLITEPLGGVCLMGGATEQDEAMKWFLQQADGGDVLVLRASGSNGYNDYLYSGLGISVNSVETILFNNATASNESYIHEKIKNAEAIWFAGGDQWNYVSYWRNTPIDSLINKGIAERNIVIGGTSAGMAIQGSSYFTAENGTVTSAQALSNPYNSLITVSDEPFLINEHLQSVITDTHYDNPDRRGRQVTFIARAVQDQQTNIRGIACDEYTAVCIDAIGLCKIYGDYPAYDEDVYFIQSNCDIQNNVPEICAAGTPLTWNQGGVALKVYRVKGTTFGTHSFDLNDWKTGSGGTWEDWSVENGVLSVTTGNEPACSIATISEMELNESVFYPNPVISNTIHVEDLKDLDVCLVDLLGKKQMIQVNKEDNTIDLSLMANGTYILTLEKHNQFHQYQLVIQR